MYFCFEGFVGGTCSGSLLGATTDTLDCCRPTSQGGLGGGSFVASGAEECFQCDIDLIGEDDQKTKYQ